MKNKPMDFKEWLLRRYVGRDTRIGDLARDVKNDSSFPETDDFDEMRAYIECAPQSCRGAVIALMEAYVRWSDYQDDFWSAQKREAEEHRNQKLLERMLSR